MKSIQDFSLFLGNLSYDFLDIRLDHNRFLFKLSEQSFH